jgi:hypothetical protein
MGMTKRAYEHLNGLLDCYLGSGDCNMAYSLIGRYSESLSFPKNMYSKNFGVRWKNGKKK